MRRDRTANQTDRVRAHTSREFLDEIDQQIEERVQYYATQPKPVISARIDELEREWDVERVLETNASSLAFTGLVLGLTVNRKWFFLTGTVLGFLFQHAVQGWCPPIPLLRRAGIRTRAEIELERYAMKALRGDFETIPERTDNNAMARARNTLLAVSV